VITLGASPVTGWAARAVGTVVTGAITASPSSTQIEVAHHVYSIEANSPAAANARSFFLGQVVDLVLTRGSASGAPEVISITAHKDS
jgi:hypothetical protein